MRAFNVPTMCNRGNTRVNVGAQRFFNICIVDDLIWVHNISKNSKLNEIPRYFQSLIVSWRSNPFSQYYSHPIAIISVNWWTNRMAIDFLPESRLEIHTSRSHRVRSGSPLHTKRWQPWHIGTCSSLSSPVYSFCVRLSESTGYVRAHRSTYDGIWWRPSKLQAERRNVRH